MVLKKLEDKSNFNSLQLGKSYKRFAYLIYELHGHDLSQNTIIFINEHIELINKIEKENSLLKQIRVSQNKVLKLLEKKHGIAPRGYYQKLWFFYGITIIGIPSGIALGIILDDLQFVWIGWLIALMISFQIGRSKGKDLARFGRQLNFKSRV